MNYPGIYVEEVPSGARTVTGIATSIAAFIGRARRGEINKAVTINSFGDFERKFGGLWQDSQMGYAVRDFYLNGGSRAIVVRLYHTTARTGAKTVLTLEAIRLEAADSGSWGVHLRASIDREDVADDAAAALAVDKADLFNLTVRDVGPGGSTERFVNLTIKESPRRIDRVLETESKLVRWNGNLDPAYPPTVTEVSDAMSQAENKLAAAKKTLSAKLVSDPENTDIEKTAVDDAADELYVAIKIKADAVSDDEHLTAADFLPEGGRSERKGLYALEQADLFNLLCIPPYKTSDNVNFDIDKPVIVAATVYCEQRRAVCLVDPPSNWNDKSTAKGDFIKSFDDYPGVRSKNAALFFPRVRQPNPLRENRMEEFAPCGAVAGVFARTDAQCGVWKAPVGFESLLVGVPQLGVNLTDAEIGELYPLGISCLRSFPGAGCVVWRARTLCDAYELDAWKHVHVRRTALFIEESLVRGTQWVVFEPNDEPLWSRIRHNVGAFMNGLFQQGAFQGSTPQDAYFVRCGAETTLQADRHLGRVNIEVGFAPLKPAEFVFIRIQQSTGQAGA